ncbi:uncharacterized protein LOC106656522 isoform X2 [Trichogramma pretiosum]|uniref:uncharacterized protein LOC106656522 isoform X2 n=1 Tax=Trichogramma pretiosum TaxID=7493 RepID=UPI0006C9BD95|nr:uncharacterized protein LOC106656522 isoform X2 [Trichogramma pretiosum]
MPSPSESPVPPPQQQQQQQLLPSSCLNGVPLEVELSKNHKLAEADVISVKSWSERRYDLPSLGESDAALFLHARNYDCERAKLLLENFFGMRRRLGCFFGQRDPDSSQLRTLFNTLTVYPLEKKSHRGRTVVLARLLDTDPHRYDFLIATKYLSMVLDALIHENGCDPGGYIFLFDLSNVTQLHRNELSVSRLRNFFAYFRDCCPARWHGLHYLDLKPGEDNLCRRSKRQFAEELSIETHFHELFHLHPTIDSIARIIPLDALPAELQGTSAHSLAESHRRQVQKLVGYRDWFLHMDQTFFFYPYRGHELYVEPMDTDNPEYYQKLEQAKLIALQGALDSDDVATNGHGE